MCRKTRISWSRHVRGVYSPHFGRNSNQMSVDMLKNYRFVEAARKASSILRDNPTSIMDKAVFWIEYVIRHKGAPQLRTAANDLYWFQFYLLDVIATISLASVFIAYLSYKCWAYLLKKICATKSKAERNVSKNKKKQ